MRIIPYTDIKIESDPRVLVVKNLLPSIMSKLNMQQSLVIVTSNNDMIAVCQLTTVFCCKLTDCIPGADIILAPETFHEDYIAAYKLQDDEYVVYDVNRYNIYINPSTIIHGYIDNFIYNSNGILRDKIEDITEYDDFGEYLNIKAAEGNKFFKGYNNNFMLPIFTKFPHIAKGDKADLYVYMYDRESDLVIWKVKKKKLGRDLYTIFRVLRLF